jgi:hypothetical protein
MRRASTAFETAAQKARFELHGGERANDESERD